ncbi:MAG: hypothetical protein RI985_955 [Chloroflexota bacterium]|jgi:O-antigen/teichoic acid export membrane protein
MRRLLTTTTIYSLSAMLGPLVALLLTPIYVATIGVAGYGVVDLVQTVVQLLIPMALWGLPTTLIARSTDSVHAQAPVPMFGGAMTLALLVSSVLSVVCILLVAPMVAYATQRPELNDLLRIYAYSLPFAAMYGVMVALMRLLGQVWRTVVLMVAYVGILAMCRLSWVVWFDTGVTGMIMALTVTNAVVALLGVVLSWRWWWARPDWTDVWQFVRLGAPLLPASLSVWMLLFIDRWFLVRYVSPLEQGQYAIAALVASLLAFVAEPFRQAWQPLARHQSDQQFDVWSLTMYVAVALSVGAGVVTWAPELLVVIGGVDARAAAPFIAGLIIAPLLSGVVAIVSMPAIRAQRTSRIAWATGTGALVNIGLNIWLIPSYGAQGAAWATALAALSIPLVHIWLQRSAQAIPYDWVRLGGVIVLWCGYVGLIPLFASSVAYRIAALICLIVCMGIVIQAWQWRQWVDLLSGLANDAPKR